MNVLIVENDHPETVAKLGLEENLRESGNKKLINLMDNKISQAGNISRVGGIGEASKTKSVTQPKSCLTIRKHNSRDPPTMLKTRSETIQGSKKKVSFEKSISFSCNVVPKYPPAKPSVKRDFSKHQKRLATPKSEFPVSILNLKY